MTATAWMPIGPDTEIPKRNRIMVRFDDLPFEHFATWSFVKHKWYIYGEIIPYSENMTSWAEIPE